MTLSPGSRVRTVVRLPRLCSAKPSGTFGKQLAADSCGGSSGLDPKRESDRIPFWPIKPTGAPERGGLKKGGQSLSRRSALIAGAV
jgi:hypothetical protein